jgi:hypothetical protein
METRPYLAAAVTRNLDELNRRLGLPKQEPRKSLKDKAITSEPPIASPQGIEQKVDTSAAANKPKKTHWIVWALVTLGIGGLLRVVLMQRK